LWTDRRDKNTTYSEFKKALNQTNFLSNKALCIAWSIQYSLQFQKYLHPANISSLQLKSILFWSNIVKCILSNVFKYSRTYFMLSRQIIEGFLKCTNKSSDNVWLLVGNETRTYMRCETASITDSTALVSFNVHKLKKMSKIKHCNLYSKCITNLHHVPFSLFLCKWMFLNCIPGKGCLRVQPNTYKTSHHNKLSLQII